MTNVKTENEHEETVDVNENAEEKDNTFSAIQIDCSEGTTKEEILDDFEIEGENVPTNIPDENSQLDAPRGRDKVSNLI